MTTNYNELGQPWHVTDAAGAHTLTYDALGQLETDTIAAANGGNPNALAGVTTISLYHGAGQAPLPGQLRSLTVQTASGGTVVQQSYAYNAATGRLDTVSDGTNSAIYGYVPNSDIVSTVAMRRGAGTILTHHRAPDNLNRLSSVSAQNGAGATLDSHTWHYNGAGQRDLDTLADGTHWDYGYNTRGEVTSGARKLGDGTPLGGYQFGYAYDAIGNRKKGSVLVVCTTDVLR